MAVVTKVNFCKLNYRYLTVSSTVLNSCYLSVCPIPELDFERISPAGARQIYQKDFTVAALGPFDKIISA